MSEHPELPDLIRKTGVPVPQVLDRSGETLAWKPAEDMAPKLDDLIEALGARATEQTLAQIKTALTTVGTENTLQLIQTALGGLNEKDFATQATLAQVLTKLGDLSTATNQEAVKLVLDTISNAVAAKATEQTLTQIKTALTDGTQKVALTGNFDTLRTPAVGRRTVTATAAELFAGASRLANRRRLVIRNEDPVLRCLIGPATVSQQTGFPIEPGAVLEVPCDPEVAVPVYAISEGASLTVAVMEI